MNVCYNFDVESLNALDTYLEKKREKGYKISKSKTVEQMVKYCLENETAFLVWQMSRVGD